MGHAMYCKHMLKIKKHQTCYDFFTDISLRKENYFEGVDFQIVESETSSNLSIIDLFIHLSKICPKFSEVLQQTISNKTTT